MDFQDYYKILSVAPDADSKTIKTAYRKLARKYHPDVSEHHEAEEKFKQIAEAYEVLKDPKKRAQYDELREHGGQGTAALETLGQLDCFPDIIITPVGGGGLLAGTAVAAHAIAQNTGKTIRVIGAEPQGASDAWQGFTSGQRVESQVPETIADGLRSTLGISNFSIITEQVNDIVLASEQAIVDAMRLVWMRMKIVIEPSAAVAVAAVMENREMFSGKRVATILSGGNVDLDALPW